MWGHIRTKVSYVLNKRREENEIASCTQSGNLNDMRYSGGNYSVTFLILLAQK